MNINECIRLKEVLNDLKITTLNKEPKLNIIKFLSKANQVSKDYESFLKELKDKQMPDSLNDELIQKIIEHDRLVNAGQDSSIFTDAMEFISLRTELIKFNNTMNEIETEYLTTELDNDIKLTEDMFMELCDIEQNKETFKAEHGALIYDLLVK